MQNQPVKQTERLRVRVAVHLILLQKDEILLLRRFQTGWADGLYCLVAGGVEENESIVQAMIREAKEEAGITLTQEQLTMSLVMHRNKSFASFQCIDFFFTTTQWEGAITNCEPDRCDDLRFFPLTKLPQNTHEGIKEAIFRSLKGEHFFEYEPEALITTQ